MRYYKLILLILIQFSLLCCTNKQFEYRNAIVYKAVYNHWGRGNFHLRIYYRFSINDKIYCGEGDYEGLLRPTGNWKPCEPGDTIIVKCQKDNPQKNYFHRIKKPIKLWNKNGEYQIKNDSVMRVIIHKEK